MDRVITIPKKLVRYEVFLKRPLKVPVAKLTPQEKRLISKSEQELETGRYLTLEELENKLAGSRTRTRK
ncbi:MAG: hypothetical protein AAB476_02095 [Patescibacteria group bacterium]